MNTSKVLPTSIHLLNSSPQSKSSNVLLRLTKIAQRSTQLFRLVLLKEHKEGMYTTFAKKAMILGT